MANAPLEEYRRQQSILEAGIYEVLRQLVLKVIGLGPEKVRDTIIAVQPHLVERYGEVAAELAVEFYRASLPAGSNFLPLPAPVTKSTGEALEKSARYHAGALFDGDTDQAIDAMISTATKHIRDRGRETMVYNAEREGVGWARVPRGAKTCAWCLALASRGAVYASKKTASASKTSDDHSYHAHCDCEVVRIGADESYPMEYLPDEALDMWERARDQADEPGDIKSVLAQMRRLYPQAVTDGVTE